jgi:hypothetical protein
VTFAAVGSEIQTTSTSLTVNPAATGHLFMVTVVSSSNTVWCTSITSSNATWTPVGSVWNDSTHTRTHAVFAGKSTATGSATATLGFNGATPTIRCVGQEFSSTVGAWSIDGTQANLSSANTNTMPSLTPVASGELYWCFGIASTTPTAGSTSGYTYFIPTVANALAFNPACTSAAQAPVWGNSVLQSMTAVLMREIVAHTSTPTLTVTPSFASNKGVGVVPSLTVTPAFKSNKGAGVVPTLAVAPHFTVVASGGHQAPATATRQQQQSGRSMLRKRLLYADL